MVSYDRFLSWAKEKFGDVTLAGDEIKINSIFHDDRGHHLWCNPSKNCYHCWKTDESGNLFDLIVKVDRCSYDEAVDRLEQGNYLRYMEQKIAEMYGAPKEKHFGDNVLKCEILKEIELPPYTFLIDNLAEDYAWRIRAETYMESRGLSAEGMFVCIAGRYGQRLVIPYYAPDETLIYWNARTLGNSKVRYMGPDDEIVGVGKSQVMYMKSWAKPESKIYLVEGEFDAMSLHKCGLNAGALGGKNLNDRQIELLHAKQYQLVKSYKICMAFDNDKSGEFALNTIGRNLLGSVKDLSYIRPPIKYKDWNEMLVNEGERIVNLYIAAEEQQFHPWSPAILRWK